MNPILWVILLILLFGGIGSAPQWGWHGGGYGYSGGFFTLLVILLILKLVGVI